MSPSDREIPQKAPREATAGSRNRPGGSAYDRWLLGAIGRRLAPARTRLRLRSGGESGFTGGAPLATITIRDRRTLTRVALDPEVEFGEAYVEGRIDFEGGSGGGLPQRGGRSP